MWALQEPRKQLSHDITFGVKGALGKVGFGRRTELLLNRIDVSQDPEFDNLPSVGAEERTAGPGDLASRRIDAEEWGLVCPSERHPGGGPLSCLDQIVNNADVTAQCGMDGPHVVDESFRSTALGTQRSAKNEVGMQDLAGNLLILPIPDLVVEALDKLP